MARLLGLSALVRLFLGVWVCGFGCGCGRGHGLGSGSGYNCIVGVRLLACVYPGAPAVLSPTLVLATDL